MKLICYVTENYKHEIEENRKILAPITDTIIALGRLG